MENTIQGERIPPFPLVSFQRRLESSPVAWASCPCLVTGWKPVPLANLPIRQLTDKSADGGQACHLKPVTWN